MTAVSILMSAYNYARFLPRAIDSVLTQSDPDWELVVIDDNSSDRTWEILSSYRDPRIRPYHSESTRPLAATLNDAYRRSTGDLITVLAADDRYRPEFVARQRAFLSDHPDIDISGTYTAEIGADGNPSDQWAVNDWFNHQLDLNDPANWVWQNRLSHGSSLARRHVFDNIGLFDEGLSTTLDWDLWVRALAAGYRFQVIPEVLFEWRVHGNNITNSNPAETVRCWSLTSKRTFHPFLNKIGRTDLKAQNIAGFLTHTEMANQPIEYTTSILETVLTGEPTELAEAISHVATEITRLRDAYVQLRESIDAASTESERLRTEISQSRVERDALGDRLHGAEMDRRAAQSELRRIQSTRLYRAARRVRHSISPR